MAELSNQSYHYKSKLSRKVQQHETEEDDLDDPSKKKQRRRKRMLTGVSKQRRAANERERKRLHIINLAYQDLKSTLPLFPGEQRNITKIEIVKLASKTIKYLSELLNDTNHDSTNKFSRSPSGSDFNEGSTTSEEPSEDEPLFDIENLDIASLLSAAAGDFNSLESRNLKNTNFDGFEGLDISCFVKEEDLSDDILPSMLYL